VNPVNKLIKVGYLNSRSSFL